MMKPRLLSWVLVLLLSVTLVVPAGAAEPVHETTILFTHDLHSHFLPQPAEGGGETGGYARLKTAIDAERALHPDALVLDAGDFSIGSLIQTLYTTQAAELRTMGAMGYDATAIGNHEFDHTGVGFAEMLNAAVEARDAAFSVLAGSLFPNPFADEYTEQYGPLTIVLPALLGANYIPSSDNPNRTFIQQAMDDYGVQETMLLERGGVTYGIFGLVGVDSHECAPSSGFELLDAVETAERCVASLKEQGAEFIICLSHSGTGDSLPESEDEVLAEKVDGIDVIVSGHTHTTLTEPIIVNDTCIVSAGSYSQNLGALTVEWTPSGDRTVTDYRLIPIDETLEEDEEIAAMVDTWKTMVGEEYLGRYGLTYDQVLTTTTFDLNTPVSGVQQGNHLGELVADAFLWAAQTLEAGTLDTMTVTVTADGVLRAPLRTGEITAAQAFDVLSMGVGADGTSGFPLVGVYLTGRELKAAAEVDASVTPIMPAAQLYMSGMDYGFNTNRMFFNRVVSAHIHHSQEIQDDQLYRVVTGMYSAQMLGTVKSKSMGLLSLEPKMADGTPVTDFNDCILRDKDGNEIKEWYALAAYLRQFGEDGLRADWYESEQGDGRKDVSHSFAPSELLANWNWITWMVLAVALLLILLVVLIVRFAIRRRRRKRR